MKTEESQNEFYIISQEDTLKQATKKNTWQEDVDCQQWIRFILSTELLPISWTVGGSSSVSCLDGL
jgi:hypothetical protein